MTGAEVALLAAAAPEIAGAAAGATAAGTAAAGTAAGAGMFGSAVAPLTAAEMAAPIVAEGAAPFLMEPMMMAPPIVAEGAAPFLMEPMMMAPGAAPTVGVSNATLMPTMQEMLAPYGGVDPHAMDMGAANFNSPWEKMRLAGAKAMGNVNFPSMMMKQGANMLGQQPQSGGGGGRGPTSFGTPMSRDEIMQRLKMLQGGRSNFAGLLGQAIGGY